MREQQRGYRNYADIGCNGMQEENITEAIRSQQQEDTAAASAGANGSNTEGMVYLDIIPRFAL